MAVLKKIFSSLGKLFGQRFPAGRRRKQRRKQKSKARKKSPFRKKFVTRRKPSVRTRRTSSKKTRAAHSIPKKNKKARGVSSAKKPHDPRASKTQPLSQPIGEVTHFFPKIQVVVVKIKKGTLVVGDKVRIHGKSTDFTQTVRSMQIESVDVRSAKSGQLIGLKVERAAKVGDTLHKLV